MDFNKGLVFSFDVNSWLCWERESSKRYLTSMRGMFADEQALEEMIKKDDEMVYEFYEMDAPEDPGDLAFGTSICYPGKVAGEYFMTKGHSHSVLETAEIYLYLKGRGMMLMENPEGDWDYKILTPNIN